MSRTGNKRNAEGVEASGVICDCKVPIQLKGIFYCILHIQLHYVIVNVVQLHYVVVNVS